jgi:hypothetical protein
MALAVAEQGMQSGGSPDISNFFDMFSCYPLHLPEHIPKPKLTQRMNIRSAGPLDVAALATIWHHTWHEAHAHLVPPELTRVRTLNSFRERIAAALPHVRVVGPPGEPLGFCIVKDDELYQLFVAASARGSGVAAAPW